MDDQSQADSMSFAFNGKIMISSISILLIACFVVILFHAYARWFRRRPIHHRRRHRLITATTILVTSDQGLDLCVMKSLPTFVYESKSDKESPLQCAVCLSDFEDAETGRALPECQHCFHVDCIDMWLQSHRDCPLCRAEVKLQPVLNPTRPVRNSDEVMVSIRVLEDSGSGSGHEMDPDLEIGGVRSGCSTSSPMLDVLGQFTGPTEHDPPKKEGDPSLNGSDIESGPMTTASSVKGLKRLFSI